MKDKNLNIMSPLLCIIYNFYNYLYNNLVDMCNITLLLFLKCDVKKFGIPPPLLSHNVELRPPPSPLMCDVIYGCPLSRRDSGRSFTY